MSKLEHTRTSSDLTTTERLRRMLDERGVEWWQSANTLGCIFTRWYSPIFGDEVVAMENGKEGLVLFDHFMTPEQAIAATLGREPDEAAIAKLHDRMNVALLECKRTLGIEKADGTIVVPLVYEMHNLLEDAAALGSCSCTNSERTGTCTADETDTCTADETDTCTADETDTCTADETDTWECVCDQIGRYGKRVTVHMMECSECGHTYEHVNGGYEFCPHCGRRCVG